MTLLALDPIDPTAGAPDTRVGRTVVVGHDGSAAAGAVVAYAGRRAGAGGYLIVVHALPLGVSPDQAEPSRSYGDRARFVLRNIENALAEDVPHEARIVAGPASKALVDVARRCDADEIVLGASTGRAARGAIGRVADSVLRHSDRPVTIVPRPVGPKA